MTVYLIADVKVTDDGWVPAYAASVHDVVHKHGGKYLSRSGNVKTLEGKPLDTTLIGDCQDFCVRRFPSCAHEALFEHDGELRLRLGPLSRRSFPIRNGVVQNQI
jgi:uncharacterized protein (DUF1330 family)